MAGVYISYPFCSQKCSYCNFASGVFPRGLELDYLAALREEIGLHQWQWTPETLYFGGGTPSLMDLAALDVLPCNDWREATMEAAPGTIVQGRVRTWRSAGINRVSLGVQSFVRKELAQTGRRHTAEIVASDVALLRAEGIAAINIDLIAGLPFQTPSSWRESLEWTVRLEPEHVSVYMLEVDEDSRLGLEILNDGARYGAREVPPDDAIADFYEYAVEFLARAGLARYEISNFARPGFESLHNLKYWRLEPYIGFGADAHSFDGEIRRQNVESPAEYVARIQAGRSPVAEETPANLEQERFFIGLRLSEGVDADWRPYDAAVRRFLGEGLLESTGSRLRLTPRGVMLSNDVFAEFVA